MLKDEKFLNKLCPYGYNWWWSVKKISDSELELHYTFVPYCVGFHSSNIINVNIYAYFQYG